LPVYVLTDVRQYRPDVQLAPVNNTYISFLTRPTQFPGRAHIYVPAEPATSTVYAVQRTHCAPTCFCSLAHDSSGDERHEKTLSTRSPCLRTYLIACGPQTEVVQKRIHQIHKIHLTKTINIRSNTNIYTFNHITLQNK
jgi:hypothetical protein